MSPEPRDGQFKIGFGSGSGALHKHKNTWRATRETNWATELFATVSCLEPTLTATVTLILYEMLRGLVPHPLFGRDGHSVGELVEGGGPGELERIGDFTVRELPEINQPSFAELQIISLSRSSPLGAGDLREGG